MTEHAKKGAAGVSVLIVEDDPAVRKATAKMLERLGHTITSCGSPEEAIALFSQAGTEIDLVLTDVLMPNMNGVEMIDRIRKFNQNVQVLFMSGYTPEYIRQRGIPAEMNSLLRKPLSLTELSRRIQEHVPPRT